MNTMLTRRDIIAGFGAAAVGGTLLGQNAAAEEVEPRATAAAEEAQDAAEALKTPGTIVKTFEFSRGSAGMLAGFSDYGHVVEGLNCRAEVRPLPPALGNSFRGRNAYYLAANNASDDIFMFLKSVLTSADGIVRFQPYLASFDIQFASQSNNCVGVGGDASAVWLKAGGSSLEPVTILTSNNEYVGISVDKGAQAAGGKDLGTIGSIWNGVECPESKWMMLRRTYTHPYPITATGEGTAGAGGQLWIALGTESGYESVTEVYYYRIKVKLTPT
jgi:hypothetical protein